MCKSSKLFISCFLVSLFVTPSLVHAKSDIAVAQSSSDKKKSNSEISKKSEDFDVSSLSGTQLGEMMEPYLQDVEGFFETIFDLKNKLKDNSEKSKIIVTYLESCKFIFSFEKDKNCFVVSVYPKNVDSNNCSLDEVVRFNLNSKSEIAFKLARTKSSEKNKSDKDKQKEKSDNKKSFDVSSLSNKEIRDIGRPYASVIRLLFGMIYEFTNGLMKESKKNEEIIDFLASCKFVLEKDNSSNKSDSFNFDIYSYDGPDAVIEPIVSLNIDENASVNFNFIKKQQKVPNKK